MSAYTRVDHYGSPKRRELKDYRNEVKQLNKVSRVCGLNAPIEGRVIRLVHKPTQVVREMK